MRNQQRFEVSLESSGVPFSIMAPVRDAAARIVDFRWTYLNRAAAQAVGGEPDTLIGRRIDEVMPDIWQHTPMFTAYVRVAERGEAQSFEYRSRRDETLWFHVVASPLQGSVAVWFADISERKRSESLLRDADRRKDEFLATLAHELRNPLAPIRQAVQLAADEHSTVPTRRWAHEVIDRQAHRMALLLDDLLDVSRITRGSLVLRRAPVALAEVVKAAVDTVRPLVEAQCHQLDVACDEAVQLDVDALRLSQVIGNLLTNAAKYTDPGGHIRLEARRAPDGLAIRVSDNGIGLTPEQRLSVFAMFAQVPEAQGRSQQGLGIGLALASSWSELHGGRIEAASDGPDRGSCFSVHLPAACVIGEAPVASAPPVLAAPAVLRHILIADDNADAADSMALLLRLEGHSVEVAYDGAAALAAFQRQRPHVALLDVGMPRLNGLQLAHAIRGLAGPSTWLVAVTGWGQPNDRQRVLDAGFDEHATKPVDIDAIRAFIARAPRDS